MIYAKLKSEDKIRFIKQHDHGLLSGEVAQLFKEPGYERLAGYPVPLLLAISSHDLGWHTIDDIDAVEALDALPFDASQGLHDFLHLPYALKIPLYLEGIRACKTLHPYAGLLISHHYTAFLDAQKYASIREDERQHREVIAATLGLASATEKTVMDDYERLKFFDLISLYICQRAPIFDDASCPAWITHTPKLFDTTYTLSWEDDATLLVQPHGHIIQSEVIDIPYKDIPTNACKDATSFLHTWKNTPTQTWSILLK